jgi:hypothetical protein
MKIIITFLLSFVSILGFSQIPQGIPYQAAARNANGQILANTQVLLRFSIIDSIANGTMVYQETHNLTTNSMGLFSTNIGMGSAVIGTFNTINWGQNFKFLKVELDTSALGNNYIDMGTQQMMSVPYALYAGNYSVNTNNSNSLFNTNHGEISLASDTVLYVGSKKLLEVTLIGGNGGNGGNNATSTGGIGGTGAGIKFLIEVNAGDSLYFKLGANGITGCNGCLPSSCWYNSNGGNGTDGTETMFSINLPFLSGYTIKLNGGTGGTGAYSFCTQSYYVGNGNNGINGVVEYGNNFNSSGILNFSNNLNGYGANVIIKW